jgi:hypothetical protein
MKLREILTAGAIATFVSVGAIATTTLPASAYEVCNQFGECYQVHRHPYFAVRFGGDDWRYRHHNWDRDRDHRDWDRDHRGWDRDHRDNDYRR